MFEKLLWLPAVLAATTVVWLFKVEPQYELTEDPDELGYYFEEKK
jgi:hypothetical protein